MTEKQSLPLFKTSNTGSDNQCRLAEPFIKLTPADAEQGRENFEEWIISATEACGEGVGSRFQENRALQQFLEAVFDLSPYLFGLTRQFPATVLDCCESGFETSFRMSLDGVADVPMDQWNEATLSKELRVFKQKAALICGLADLGGWWSWETVSRTIATTADTCVQVAVRYLLHEAHTKGKLALPNPGEPETGSGYVVLAMGKHGAGELNYSSDIDLIVLFDPMAPAITEPEESVALFVRLTKSLVRLLQERTGDGYAFRTDLRLRPDPGSMPLAIPRPVALNYYESRGQNWERAAMVKARPVAGEIAVGQEFLDELTPFVWRRYLDYAAISDVHSIKRQIQTHRGYSEVNVPGHNVKLGRGGVREIEFFVQTQQLIAGGRNPKLRGNRTLETLDALVANDWIEQSTRDDLAISYAFLRDVEHRLQMVSDAQTHIIPSEEEELNRIAHLCGSESVEDFSSMVLAHLNNVEQHYAALFENADELSAIEGNLSFTGDEDDPGTLETLQSMGYSNPSMAISIVRGWHYGRHPVVQSETARAQLTELTPALLRAIADAKRADETLLDFEEFLKGLPSGVQLFAILQANPKILDLLALVMGAAPRLARIITRRPHIFDGVLEPGFFDITPDVAQWDEALQRSLQQARDYEDGLDRVRIFAAEQKFLLGIRLISGSISPQQAGVFLTELAEMLLLTMVDWVHGKFAETHGEVPGADFAIIGMGNLGTYELTAGSDLDVILIYRFDEENDESDGGRPLHASQYFGRFAQRLIAAMSAPTAQGVVYELDFRLRPNGAAGPIATSLRAFEQYYAEQAWTWERLALTRGRVLGPATKFSASLERAMKVATQSWTDRNAVAKQVYDMRAMMDKERAAKDTWDVKLAEGGLIDIEFLVQLEVLLGDVQRQPTTAETLASIEAPELQNDNVTLQQAHSNYLSVIQVLRLCLEEDFSPKDAPRGTAELLLRQLELPDMGAAEAYLKDSQTAVREIFSRRMEALSASS